MNDHRHGIISDAESLANAIVSERDEMIDFIVNGSSPSEETYEVLETENSVTYEIVDPAEPLEAEGNAEE
jgi:hypothetical protein